MDDNNDQNQDQAVDYDKVMAEQAARMMENKKTIGKKKPLITRDSKKLFDSADYFKDKDQEGHQGEEN